MESGKKSTLALLPLFLSFLFYFDFSKKVWSLCFFFFLNIPLFFFLCRKSLFVGCESGVGGGEGRMIKIKFIGYPFSRMRKRLIFLNIHKDTHSLKSRLCYNEICCCWLCIYCTFVWFCVWMVCLWTEFFFSK